MILLQQDEEKKIVKSTQEPECAIALDKGGYTVHPVPASLSTILPLRPNPDVLRLPVFLSFSQNVIGKPSVHIASVFGRTIAGNLLLLWGGGGPVQSGTAA